jgi:hypothetical protein
MTYDNPKMALATASEPATTVAADQLVALRQCLVVSAHSERREALRRAAIEGGWLPLVFADAQAAWDESRRSIAPLALVDVHDAADRPDDAGRRLIERLSRESGRLVAVCGADDLAPGDEIWARQLGAWVVLPGVADAHDLAPIYEQAGKALERMAQAAAPVARSRRAMHDRGPRRSSR